MGVDPGRLCGCTIGCVMSKIETRRKGVICRYHHGEVKPDSYFVVGGDPTPRRALPESVEVVPPPGYAIVIIDAGDLDGIYHEACAPADPVEEAP